MYHVLRSMDPFKPAGSNAWEEKFCKAIATYMGELVALVGPTKGVYVSCDGAVCAAKRRQQRMRRFKGPWVSALEAAVTGKTVPSGWDQNALTPGSAFMARLGLVLTAAGASLQKSLDIPVIVSTTAEGGEGEHKLMAFMRSIKPASCTIYGLDADLILLAMLLVAEGCSSVRLLREAQEFEGGSLGFRSLDINGFAAALIPNGGSIRDFVAAMSLLGNDFLPRSLTRTVRDDGIPTVIATLQATVWSSGVSLVTDGSLNRESLVRFIEAWAATEEQDLVATVVTALKAADRRPAWAATPEEATLKEWQAQPSRWASVRQLTTGRGLKPGWRSVYQSWHPGTPANYVAGLAWVWDYYSGRPVDQGWMFDEHLPPLWSDVASYLRSLDAVKPPPVVYPEPLPDWLHLLAVLPAASVATLLPVAKQRLMGQHPWYWPSSWSIFDVGRSQLWECEPVIPMIPEEVLRQQI
jgi:5'-3' exonuclease